MSGTKVVEVTIEEHLSKTVQIEVPDDLDCDERLNLAEQIAKEQYKNGEIILEADDFNGTSLIQSYDLETDVFNNFHDF